MATVKQIDSETTLKEQIEKKHGRTVERLYEEREKRGSDASLS